MMMWTWIASAMAVGFVLPDNPMHPGSVDITVDAPRPEGPVYLFLSLTGPGSGPCVGSTCLGITEPILLDVLRDPRDADPVVSFQLPQDTDGRTFWLQMAQVSGDLILRSPPKAYVVGDSDLDGIADSLDVCPTVPDPWQIDDDGDGYGLACDCEDRRADIHPDVLVDPPMDGIDQDCDRREGLDDEFTGRYHGPVQIDGYCDVALDFEILADGSMSTYVFCAPYGFFFTGGGVVGDRVDVDVDWELVTPFGVIPLGFFSRVTGVLEYESYGIIADLGQGGGPFRPAGTRLPE